MILCYLLSDFIIEENEALDSFAEYAATLGIEKPDNSTFIEAYFPVLPSKGDEINLFNFMDKKHFSDDIIEKAGQITFVVTRIVWTKGNGEAAIPILYCDEEFE